ncbi:tetratricopeptide repeat protein [Microbispora sp. RL4-1S]|uniref:Tetratricopeptide repeat protein n=1 Tax=Microbispora oryzae TaxID=2806554 RepID=A0A940WBA5_9ACTN|nr:AfsR/SARP family transcriptional regulator [Microbispora oryzae]MBP2702274.1 tetratricopeptide repeat protein [Microbispora oryzae]
MRFQVIGAVSISDGDVAVPLTSPRQEQLLCLLVCSRGRTMPAEALTDALWGGRRAGRPGKNLQVLVHRLRRTLGDPGRIRHDRSGYSLVATADEVDAWLFDDLAERGRRALDRGDLEVAATLLAEALALGDGPAYPGLHDIPQLAHAAERIEQERRQVLAARLDAELALGRHIQMIPELVALLAADPLVESSAARLMTALHRAGRRAEALDVYQRTRAVLAGELGVEPGPSLRALHAALLRGEEIPSPAAASPGGEPAEAGEVPEAGKAREAEREAGNAGEARPTDDRAPEEPAQAPALLPPPIGDMTGRDAELGEVIAALARPPVVCVLSGMAGVGKTALAVQAAHALRDSFPGGQLFVNLQGAGGEPVTPHQALGRFLRALGVAGPAVPEGVDERAEVFRGLLSHRRVLVVLDDAADEEQVQPLLPAGDGCAVLITSRGRLTALPAARGVPLGLLDSGAAVELLRAVSGRAEFRRGHPPAEELAALCGRLPLALRIAGARLAARPHWSVPRLVSRLAAEHDRLDELTHGPLSVRAGLALGYSGLAEVPRTLFRRLGLIETPDFAGWVAAALLDSGTRPAEDALESLVEAQLVGYAGVDGVGEPRYRMHDLVRLHAKERAAADDPPGAAEAALGRLAGAYLALAEEAHRREYGGDYTVLHGPGRRWRPDPATADRLLADPGGWLRGERLGLVAAVGQAAAAGLHEVAWDLAMSAVTLFEAQGHFDDWARTARTALDAARRAGDLRGVAAMRYSQGTLEIFRQRYAAARPHFEAALQGFTSVGDRHGQALTLRNSALIERVEGRLESALAAYRRALGMLREVGDRHAEAHVLGSIAQIHVERGDGGEAEPLLRTALRVYRELGDPRGTAQILNRLGGLHLAEGRPADAGRAFQEVLTTARAVGDRIGEAYGLLGLGEAALLDGGLDQAAAHLDAATALAVGLGEPFVAARACLARGRLAAESGEHERAAALLGQAAARFDEIGLPAWHARAVEARRAAEGLASRP